MMSKTMTRDEARVWLASNPGREVIDAQGVRWTCTQKGNLRVNIDLLWLPSASGLMECGAPFTIVEPEKPQEDELVTALRHWRDAGITFADFAAALRAEITRIAEQIADERLAKARVEQLIMGDWVPCYHRLIPGDK